MRENGARETVRYVVVPPGEPLPGAVAGLYLSAWQQGPEAALWGVPVLTVLLHPAAAVFFGASFLYGVYAMYHAFRTRDGPARTFGYNIVAAVVLGGLVAAVGLFGQAS